MVYSPNKLVLLGFILDIFLNWIIFFRCNKFIVFTDLMDRYNLTRQAVLQYLAKHLDEVNTDGAHAYKIKGDWQLDATALERLDKSRGYNTNLALEAEIRQKQREYELLEEISSLKTAMLTVKEQYQQTKENLYQQLLTEKDRAHAAELLQIQSRDQIDQLQQAADTARAEAAQARQQTADAIKATADERAAKAAVDAQTAAELAELKAKYKAATDENNRLKITLQQEQKKSWLDKLLGK